MGVPVQNIYYLLCYARDYLQYENLVSAAVLRGDHVEDLLGAVLVEGVSRLLKNGVDQGYLSSEETGRSLRGKVLLAETVSRLLLQQGRVACQVDELSRDIPHNRVLKAAMRALADCESLN